MTNPAQAIRALVTYAVCIPLAALVGYLLCNPLDFGTLGFFGLVALLLASPILIRWHYPLMVFGLGAPISCFFLKGSPPLSQVVVMLSLGIAIVDRAMSSQKRFITPSVMVWPMLFVIAVTYATAELTGGIGLKTLGGDVAGGKKYITLFIGCATLFALTSQVIPKQHRKFYVALYFLSGTLQVFSDLFPYLPSPLNYINLLIPPSESALNAGSGAAMSRLGGLGAAAGGFLNFMVAIYGLRGIFRGDRPLRLLTFLILFGLTMIGGFRIVLVSLMSVFTLLFFIERLHRTRAMPVIVLVVVFLGAVVVPFSDKLPLSMQRTLSFLPLKLDSEAVMDAEGSKRWREEIWQDTWPKVPQYLLLGKGYALTAEDFEMMGNGQFAGGAAMALDHSLTGLAISSDFHNGPLSTLIPFGLWGALAFIWVASASLFVMYRNFKYSEPELKTVNTYLFVVCVQHVFGFFFLFGAFPDDIGGFARQIGFSIALNWGVCAVKKSAVTVQQIRRLPRPLAAA